MSGINSEKAEVGSIDLISVMPDNVVMAAAPISIQYEGLNSSGFIGKNVVR